MKRSPIHQADALLITAGLFSLTASSVMRWLDPNSSLIWISLFILAIGFCIRNYKNPPIFILSTYILYFSTPPYHLYFKGVPLTGWSQFQSISNFSDVIYYLNWFLLAFTISTLGLNKSNLPKCWENYQKHSTPAFYISLIFCCLSIYFGLSGETILEASYYQGETERSSLHEYFIIPFFGLLLFHKKTSGTHKATVYLLFFIFIIKTALYGGRIEILQIGLLLVYFTKDFLRDISTTRIVASATVAYLAFTIIGLARSDILSLANYITNPASLVDTLITNNQPDYISSTATEVLYSSARLHGLVDLEEITTFQRLTGFLMFLFNAAAPSSFWPDFANLSRFKSFEFPSNGGGLISSYFYVWLSFIGPILAGWFCGKIISALYKRPTKSIFFYSTLVLISFPRWMTYNPTGLMKFCLVGTIFLYLISRLSAINFKNTKIIHAT